MSKYITWAIAHGSSEVWITEWDAGDRVINDTRNVNREKEWLMYWQTQPLVTRVFYYQDFNYPLPGDGSPLTDPIGDLTIYGNAYR